MTSDSGDTAPSVTVRAWLAWWLAGRKVLRLLGEAEKEQWDELPPDCRPPAGEWIPGDAARYRSVRLEATGDHQDTLAKVVEVFREDDDDDVAAWSWLDIRVDDPGVERVAVLVGSHLIGFLASAESRALENLVRSRAKPRKAVWVYTFIEREDDIYVASVNLP